MRARRAGYVEINREKANAAVREWRKKYPERGREADRAKAAKKPELYREIHRNKHRANRAKYAAIRARTTAKNAAKISASAKLRYQRDRDRIRANHKKWATANPHRLRAAKGKRRAAEILAKASWANADAIAAIYQRAAILTEITGIPHHVDHIVPLNSPIVCGLHVVENLAAIPSFDNFSKSNKRWPYMPETAARDWLPEFQLG